MELIVTSLEDTEHRFSMKSQFSSRHVLITGKLNVPSFVEFVANIVGVWPPTISYLRETGTKRNGDS